MGYDCSIQFNSNCGEAISWTDCNTEVIMSEGPFYFNQQFFENGSIINLCSCSVPTSVCPITVTLIGDGCNLPSSTPTPTPTITPTPGTSPSQTPTVTPTKTTTPTATSNYVYVYESCTNISPNIKKTQVVQTTKSPITSIVGRCFRDSSGNCWKYNGQFLSGYVVPSTFMTVSYSGNYFASAPTTTYSNCSTCAIVPVTVDVSAGAAFCNSGTSIGALDDKLLVQVDVLPVGSVYYPLNVATTFTVDVYYVPWGSTCITADVKDGSPIKPTFQTFTVVVPAGGVIGQVNNCGPGGAFIPGRHVVCGACITSVSGNTVDTITVENPLGC